MRLTQFLQLLAIEPGDDPYANGHQFFAADRDAIDRALERLFQHRHDGAAGAETAPEFAPDLTVSTDPDDGGRIPAGVRLYYAYSLVSQATGLESAVSPSAFIDTPERVEPPGQPILSRGSTGGTLQPGNYYYRMSAWTDTSTNETNAGPASGVNIPVGTVTNRVIVEFPEPEPFGADGYNIYRRKPGGANYDYIGTVDLTVATPPTEFVDGGLLEDCDRIAPTVNRTNSTNRVTVTLPDDIVPVGYTWKLYRTVDNDNWSLSLLEHVVAETAELSGIITPIYNDIGAASQTGTPTSIDQSLPNPDPIELTDGLHVQGRLPVSFVDQVIVQSFEMPGTPVVIAGDMRFYCPVDGAVVLGAVAGVTDAPTTTPIICDVLVNGISIYSGATPTVPVAAEFGAFVHAGGGATPQLAPGDYVTVDVTQADAAASNLVVHVTLAVLVDGVTTTQEYS